MQQQYEEPQRPQLQQSQQSQQIGTPTQPRVQKSERSEIYVIWQGLRARSAGQVEGAQTLGERAMPYLLALVEACTVNGVLIALAGLGFLHTSTALLPFWGPPALLLVALWYFRRVLGAEARVEAGAKEVETRDPQVARAAMGLLFVMLGVLDVVLIWGQLYAGAFFLLDPRWLVALSTDLLSLNNTCYQAVMIVVLSVFLCWRATKLGQTLIEPARVWRELWIGLLVLLAAVLLRGGAVQGAGGTDAVVLVLLIPALFYFALSTHALARLSFVRRMHPIGLDGSAEAQERSILSIVGIVGLALFGLTLIGALFFSQSFFESVQPALQGLGVVYNWLVTAVITVLSWLLYPIFWLMDRFVPAPQPKAPNNSTGIKPLPIHLVPANQDYLLSTITVIGYIVPFLILLIVSLVLWRALRRRQIQLKRRRRASLDIRVSIWSWQLFWGQFKAFWLRLFRRKKSPADAALAAELADPLPTEPAARTIREIYRALLKRAAMFGLSRERDETPREFQQRLNSQLQRDNEPQLGQLTEAYALTRYGGDAPGELDVARARSAWDELSGKWTHR